MYAQLEFTERQCMFCGQELANRGEAYYDHLTTSRQCELAWKDWKENLDRDRPGGA